MATVMSNAGTNHPLTARHWEVNPVIYYAIGVALALFLFFHYVVDPMKGDVPATTLTYKVQPQIQDVDIKRVPVTNGSQKANPAPSTTR
jgi:hypothetical protein